MHDESSIRNAQLHPKSDEYSEDDDDSEVDERKLLAGNSHTGALKVTCIRNRKYIRMPNFTKR